MEEMIDRNKGTLTLGGVYNTIQYFTYHEMNASKSSEAIQGFAIYLFIWRKNNFTLIWVLSHFTQ